MVVRQKAAWREARPYGLLRVLFRNAGDLQQRESRGWFDGYDDPMFKTPHSETAKLVYRAELRVELM